MDKKTTIIIAAVVAILVVAVAAFALMGNDDEKEVPSDNVITYPEKDPSVYHTEGLPVFGNADGNQVIDENDADIIAKIINKKDGYTIDKYPFADANYDLKVDKTDVDLVNDIIAKKDVKIHHLNYMNESGTVTKIYIKEAKWPAKNAIVSYSTNLTLMKALGLEDKVIASPDKNAGGWFDQELLGFLNNDSVMPIDTWGGNVIDQVNNIVDKTQTHTIFSSGYSWEWADEENIEKATGCDIIRTCESNPDMPSVYASILLMGFMFDELDAGKAFADLSKETAEGVEKIANSISDKVLFACGMSSETNQHAQKCIMAGGEYAFKGCGQDPGGYEGYTFGDWAYKYQIDSFIHVSNANLSAGTFMCEAGPNANALLAEVSKYADLEVYKTGDFDFVYAGLPLAFDPLLRGYAMYPDAYADFYESQLDKLFVFFGKNPAGENFADLDMKMVISLEEMKALAEKQKA